MLVPMPTTALVVALTRWRYPCSRTLVASALLAGLAFTSPAFAGECPAGQIRADATKPSTAAAKAVTDMVLAQIDLAGEKLALAGHMMRVRKLEVQPGGVVPWHSHGDRPALIYVMSGEIVRARQQLRRADPAQRPARWRARRMPRPIGGTTRARHRSCCCRSTSCTIPTTTTCDPEGYGPCRVPCARS